MSFPINLGKGRPLCDSLLHNFLCVLCGPIEAANPSRVVLNCVRYVMGAVPVNFELCLGSSDPSYDLVGAEM